MYYDSSSSVLCTRWAVFLGLDWEQGYDGWRIMSYDYWYDMDWDCRLLAWGTTWVGWHIGYWHGIGTGLGMIGLEDFLVHFTFVPSRFPFLSWVARLPPQFLESIVVCTALLHATFWFCLFFLFTWSWLAKQEARMQLPLVWDIRHRLLPHPSYPHHRDHCLPPLPPMLISDQTSTLGERETGRSKAATFLMLSFSSFVGGYLPFYFFASFSTKLCDHEVTTSRDNDRLRISLLQNLFSYS